MNRAPFFIFIASLFVALFLVGVRPADAGILFLSGDDAEAHCRGENCGNLYPLVLRAAVDSSRTGGAGILAIGVNGGGAETALREWNDSPAGPRAAITLVVDLAAIAAIDFAAYQVVYLPTDVTEIGGGIRADQVAALAARRDDLQRFINDDGGSLVALSQSGVANGYSWLPVPLQFQEASNFQVLPTDDLLEFVPDATAVSLSHDRYHTQFPGPPGYSGLKVLARAADDGTPVILGFEGGAVAAGPVCTVSPRTSFTVVAGAAVQFRVTGAHPSAPSVVLEAPALPVGAVATPSFPVAGPGVGTSAEVAWTPAATDVGTHVLRFVARAGDEVSRPCEVRIVVLADGDRTPPRLDCPADIRLVVAPGEDGAVATYTTTATDDRDPAPRVTFTPPSGSFFRIGRSRVVCEALDASGNRSTCSFDVVVEDRASATGGIVISILGPTHVRPDRANPVTVIVENRGESAAGPFPVLVTFPPELAVTMTTPTGELAGTHAADDAADPLGRPGPEGTDVMLLISGLEAGGRKTIEFETRVRADFASPANRTEIRAIAAPPPVVSPELGSELFDCLSEWLFFGAGKALKKLLGEECAASLIEETSKLLFDAYRRPGDVFKMSTLIKYGLKNAAGCQSRFEPADTNLLELGWDVLPLIGRVLTRVDLVVECYPFVRDLAFATASLAQYLFDCLPNAPDLGEYVSGAGGPIDIEFGHLGPGSIVEIQISVNIGGGVIGPGGEGCVNGDCHTLDGGDSRPGGGDSTPGWGDWRFEFDPRWDIPGIGRWTCEQSPDGTQAETTIDAVDPATGQQRALATDGTSWARRGRQTLHARPDPALRSGDRMRVRSEVRYSLDDSTLVIADSSEVIVDRDGPVVHFTEARAGEDGRSMTLAWDGADLESGIAGYAILQSIDGADPELVHSGGAGVRATVVPASRAGSYRFVLFAVDRVGNTSAADEARIGLDVPATAVVLPGHPGGDRPEIQFGMPRAGRVQVVLYDVRGRLVRRVLDETRAAGWWSVTWDGRQESGATAPPGVYFARLRLGEETLATKIVRVSR